MCPVDELIIFSISTFQNHKPLCHFVIFTTLT
jgi:hypothetical protein